MRKLFVIVSIFLTLFTSGCSTVGDKSTSFSLIYGTAALFSLLLLAGCYFLVRKNKLWFILLFSSVFVVNSGYTILSVATSLEMALQANRLAYLGSVFLPFAMLMIILNVTNIRYKKFVPFSLLFVSAIVFLIAASPGILPIYYKEVSFQIIDGAATLIKVYGPLHPLYLFYLIGYFVTMVTIIIRASVKRTVSSTAHGVILTIAVFVNFVVWLIEQLTNINFEMLSISYIISELFLLGIHLVMTENQRLREIVNHVEAVKNFQDIETHQEITNSESETIDPTCFETFISGIEQLTATEKAIYQMYIARQTTKEVMAQLNIKENTLKYHNKNIYGKLGVSSRKELLEIYKQIKTVKEKLY
ncbi:MAG: hypothetical protein E7388_07695 [Ruminococcaceae bacterium]|nr:hypothetical protein [Oscillospiraceae bacterium]